MPIRHQIVGNAKEPRCKGEPPIDVGIKLVQRPVKGAGREIFSILHIADPMKHVGVDPVNVAFVEQTKGRRVAAGLLDERRFGRIVGRRER
jgi:hypothetical protein